MTFGTDARSPGSPPAGPSERDEAFDTAELPALPPELLEPPPGDPAWPSPAPDPSDEVRTGLWDRLGDRWATVAAAGAAGLVLVGALVVMAMLTDGFEVASVGTGRTGGDRPSASSPAQETPAERPSAPGAPPATATPSPSAPTAPETDDGLPRNDDDHDEDPDDKDDDDVDDAATHEDDEEGEDDNP